MLDIAASARIEVGTEAKVEARAQGEVSSVAGTRAGARMADGQELSLALIVEPRMCAVLMTLAGAQHFPWTGAKPGVGVKTLSREWASAGPRHDLNDKLRAGGGTGA